MRVEHITDLAKLIDENTTDSLQRQLQLITYDLRYAKDQNNIAQLTHKKTLLTHAHTVKTWETPNDSEPTSDTPSLIKIAYWLSTKTEWENYQALTMHCFLNFFSNEISDDIYPGDIIVLGNAFIDKPLQFMGYLFWLLENNVHPRDIHDTNLIKNFFAFHVCEIESIPNAYQYLNCSQQSSAFLTYSQSIPCALRGFPTYNLMGTTLTAPPEIESEFESMDETNSISTTESYDAFEEIPASQPPLTDSDLDSDFDSDSVEPYVKTKLPVNIDLQDQADRFFALFGWDFINALSLNHPNHFNILTEIIMSRNAVVFIQRFTHEILSGTMTPYLVLEILTNIRVHFWQENSHVTEDQKETLISENPLLVHALPKQQLLHYVPFIIVKFKNGPQYHCIPHIALLVTLYEKIRFSIIDIKHKNALLSLIFQMILPHGNALPDDTIFPLNRIRNDLLPIYQNFLRDHKHNIANIITEYINRKADFDAVESLWSNHLSIVNFIIHCHPELKKSVLIPYSKYDLHQHIINAIALSEHPKEKLQDHFTLITDPITKIRIQQETLLNSNCDEAIKLVLNSFLSANEFLEFLLHPTFTHESLITHALLTCKIQLLVKIIHCAERKNCFEKMAEHLTHQIDEMALHPALYPATTATNFRTLIASLNVAMGEYKPFQMVIKKQFTQAIKDKNYPLTKFMLELKPSPFCKTDILRAITDMPVINFNFNILLFLCGMDIHSAGIRVIAQNNHSSYLYYAHKILTAIPTDDDEVAPPSFFSTLAERQKSKIIHHKDRHGNNLLHLAAANRHLVTLRRIFAALENELPTSEITALLHERNHQGQIPCARGYGPTIAHINYFLDAQRQLYPNPTSPTLSLSSNASGLWIELSQYRKRHRTLSLDSDTTRDDQSESDNSTLALLNMQF